MKLHIARTILFLLAGIIHYHAFSQYPSEKHLYVDPQVSSGKPVIDFAAIDNWKVSAGISITDDGKYWSYISTTYGGIGTRTVLQSTEGKIEYKIPGHVQGVFSGNSKWYIYQQKDSLFFLPLESGVKKIITGVIDYKINEGKQRGIDKVKWLAYTMRGNEKKLILVNLENLSETQIQDVKEFSFHTSGKWLICQLKNGNTQLRSLKDGSDIVIESLRVLSLNPSGDIGYYLKKNASGQSINRIELESGRKQTLWERTDLNLSLGSLVQNQSGTQLVFTIKEALKSESSIWFYQKGKSEAIQKWREGSSGIPSEFKMNGAISFSDNDQYILIDLVKKEKPVGKPALNAVQVDIWHYKDTVIQSAQLQHDKSPVKLTWLEPRSYKAVLSVNENRIILLEDYYSRVGLIANDIAIVRRDIMSAEDLAQVYKPKPDSIWFVSLKDGSRNFWKSELLSVSLKPSVKRKYILWFDRGKGHYFTYNFELKREINISLKVPVFLGEEMEVDPVQFPSIGRTGIIGWTENDANVLVYDSYDVWQLDPDGIKQPICITGGYGRKNGIIFRLAGGIGVNQIDVREPISSSQEVLLSAYDTRNYQNGFLKAFLNKPGIPEKLYMSSCFITGPDMALIPNNGNSPELLRHPLKARDVPVWIVSRQTANDAPNFFVSKDLKKFVQLTKDQSQNEYNWQTTELVRFKQMDGTMSQGILYKPENFNPAKKYPLIISYYFQYSHLLNAYEPPGYARSGMINIAWFVSRGYLVFMPDIYFTGYRPRPASAWNTVEGAGMHLRKLPYVDSSRIGLSGHSRSGGYTNYIITHSKLFAAALEGAGVSNWVSAQHTLNFNTGQVRGIVGQEPFIFSNKGFMLDNPILNVDKVVCPLLIMHNKNDSSVPWEQAIEMYIAMRRLGKPAWMLQYDGESHLLSKRKAKEDLTIRVTQFFDHYLKGAPAPVWMTKGVPAKLKGIETGLELDSTNAKIK